ncbi:serine hydrolase domain-containing protein [uncultured Devosia sp.]|uniref:serine hydrolase domain-containing protein n=1 Tax=uncultured Devosia sp. TaxID=211434 RepID=UPI00262B4A4C|nr:serine hydrolase domain-containing protein [uncultured Devosia sp.]
MRLFFILLALGVVTAARADAPRGSIGDFIAAEMAVSGVPGLAYAIVKNGEFQSDAYGEVLIGSGRLVTPDTPFLLGSISKSFTAMAVMRLVEVGKVDLDAPISHYLKAFADQSSGAITTRQLLSHTSGYSTLQGNEAAFDPVDDKEALSRQVDRIAGWTPAYVPGTKWEYSNANYQIAGALIEAVSGRGYASYIRTEILDPIGMTHSFVADGQIHDEMARGHRPWFGTKHAMEPDRTNRVTAPQGGVIASARDLARYLAIMMNGADDIISSESKAAMLRPASTVSPFYGLGWFLSSETGTAFHSGSSPGVETLATLMPAQNKGVVVLVNAGSGIGFGETTELRTGISARALGLDYAGEGSRWEQKAVFVALVLLPIAYVLSMIWAWLHRDDLRAKSGWSGQFSLWFPLCTTLGIAGIVFLLIPRVFGASIETLSRFQPDLGIAFVATAATGVLWAAFRLGLAYSRPDR